MSRSTSLRSAAAALFATLILLSLAAAAGADHDGPGVTLYRDVHFEGRYETFNGDVAVLKGTHIGNDTASSIALAPGCRVTLFGDAYFRGPAITVRHDLEDLRTTRVGNDRVSSLRLDCYEGPSGGGYHGGPQRGVTVYSDADFGGRVESFTYDDPDLRDNPIRQDTISSVYVDRGCRAVLYEHAGFRGAATVLTGELPSLRTSEVGNDRVSSIQVDCRRHRR